MRTFVRALLSSRLMHARKLQVHCPKCGSSEIVYSCEPKCCFNHVCSECTTSFQTVSVASGEKLSGVKPPDPLPDCTEPAVACARCDSVAVYQLEDDRLICLDCGTILALQLTEVS